MNPCWAAAAHRLLVAKRPRRWKVKYIKLSSRMCGMFAKNVMCHKQNNFCLK